MADGTFSVTVVGPQFVAASQMALTVSEKRIKYKGSPVRVGTPVVTDVNGNLVFKIKSCTLSSRRIIVDNADRPVVSVHPKMSLHRRCHVFKGDSREMGDLLCMVKSVRKMHPDTLCVFLPGNTKEKVPDFRIKSKQRNEPCTVYLGNSKNIIAQMSKDTGVLHNTNSVTVCPNVDYAFIVALSEVITMVTPEGLGIGNLGAFQ